MALWIAQVIGLVLLVGGAFIVGVTVGDDLRKEHEV
ncbi:hypothetical protein [Leuconostoc phage LLC-1]|nr:hypothetical protein [Leuconostoc phage LLC-1]